MGAAQLETGAASEIVEAATGIFYKYGAAEKQSSRCWGQATQESKNQQVGLGLIACSLRLLKMGVSDLRLVCCFR